MSTPSRMPRVSATIAAHDAIESGSDGRKGFAKVVRNAFVGALSLATVATATVGCTESDQTDSTAPETEPATEVSAIEKDTVTEDRRVKDLLLLLTSVVGIITGIAGIGLANRKRPGDDLITEKEIKAYHDLPNNSDQEKAHKKAMGIALGRRPMTMGAMAAHIKAKLTEMDTKVTASGERAKAVEKQLTEVVADLIHILSNSAEVRGIQAEIATKNSAAEGARRPIFDEAQSAYDKYKKLVDTAMPEKPSPQDLAEEIKIYLKEEGIDGEIPVQTLLLANQQYEEKRPKLLAEQKRQIKEALESYNVVKGKLDAYDKDPKVIGSLEEINKLKAQLKTLEGLRIKLVELQRNFASATATSTTVGSSSLWAGSARAKV